MGTKNKLIGCGYCAKEKTCSIHDPKVNKAKLGCTDYEQLEVFILGTVQPVVNIRSKEHPFYIPTNNDK